MASVRSVTTIERALVHRAAIARTVVAIVALAAPLVTAQSALEPGVPIARTLQSGEHHVYSLTLRANDCAHIELRTELDFSVAVRRPDGTEVEVHPDAGEEWAPLPFTVVAPAAGSYSIELRLPKEEKGGSYRLLLAQVAPATDADRQQMEGELLLRDGMRLFTQTARDSRLAAAAKYRKAEEIFHGLGNREMEAKTVDKRGQVYNRLGETVLALEAYNQVLGLYRALGNRGNEASTLNNIGLEYVNQGRASEAIEPLKTAAALFEEIGDTWTMRSPVNNLGMAYLRMAEIDKSTEQYRRALAIAQTNYDESGEAYARVGLGSLALAKGSLQTTLDEYTRAYELFKKLGNNQLAALSLGNVGTTHFYVGDAESALDYHMRAQELRKLAPNRISEAATLASIASAYRLLGQPQKALTYADDSIRLYKELNDTYGVASSLVNRGAAQAGLGDLDAAAASYEEAHRLARDANNRGTEVYALSGLSRARFRQGRHDDAVTFAGEAVTVARQNGLRMAEEEALLYLANAESAANALDSARTHVEEAIELQESIRASVAGPDQRSAYFGYRHDGYRLLADVLMRMHRNDPTRGLAAHAFEVSERARARTMIDLIAESRSNIREGVDAALLAREQSLRAALSVRRAESDERVQSLLVEYRAVQNDIRARSPRYASLVQPQAATLDVVRREILDEDTVLLEYLLGEERSYVWVVSPSAVVTRELPRRADIEKLARSAYDTLSQPQAAAPNDALRALARAIVDPVAGDIGTKRLAVVTEGALQYIPFAALPDGSGRPIIESREVVTLPSISTLQVLRAEMRNREPAPRSVLVVGDPVFDQNDPRVRHNAGERRSVPTVAALTRSANESGAGSLDRLMFTRREADGIASLARDGGARKLVDFEASLDRIQGDELTNYRIVHFATHGLLNNRHPELSGLVFSLVDDRGRPRNGFLPAYEVYNLRLNADLVVLSACQTALGEEIRGEGLVGLTRAFMYAGTPRVVASLWRVPDSATAALMQRFYQALLVDRASPAEALRAAQQAIRAERRWAAPYYWAGFTLVGEWN
jgi:CHAT domain-containing protein/tetratricopeptide (TPR) repeat protein